METPSLASEGVEHRRMVRGATGAFCSHYQDGDSAESLAAAATAVV